MTNHPNRSKKCRPKEHLRAALDCYPEFWKKYDDFRQNRGKNNSPGWPEWCYCPSDVCAVVFKGGEPGLDTVTHLGALAAWRLSQGVYRFDPSLYTSIVNAPVGKLSKDDLCRLPEWCVYIETVGLAWANNPLAGFFADLEYNTNTELIELRFLLDVDSCQGPVLIGQSLCIDESILDIPEPLKPLLNLVLYLCDADFGENGPHRPLPKKTKKGWKLFPPDKPQFWIVGNKENEGTV